MLDHPATTAKACRDCGIAKPLSEFYTHPTTADGYMNSCKVCRKNYERLHRLSTPSVQERERLRAKTPQKRASISRVAKTWRQRNPQARAAHSAVARALRTGKITREPCVICSATKNIHAHHRDYAQPLSVTWLCVRCHSRIHKAFPEIEGLHK